MITGIEMTLGEYLKTRLVEIVVHGRDLTDSVAIDPVDLSDQCWQEAAKWSPPQQFSDRERWRPCSPSPVRTACHRCNFLITPDACDLPIHRSILPTYATLGISASIIGDGTARCFGDIPCSQFSRDKARDRLGRCPRVVPPRSSTVTAPRPVSQVPTIVDALCQETRIESPGAKSERQPV